MDPITNNGANANGINEWTIMFFFASDNELSPLIIDQLKAIKDAGYQENTEVLVYFDSNEKGGPTRLYNVNRRRKTVGPKTEIGDRENPYVRNLAKDNVVFSEINGNGHKFSNLLSESLAPGNQDTTNALDALKNFIGFAREKHKAKHYMLFLVGHGMIVGNDAFLPDEAPRSAITLTELGQALHGFSDTMKEGEEAFELLALHSCSMSAIEVAYELQGTAKYMMASEGISFVGSWPYRQLLKKIFKTIEDAKDSETTGVDVETLLQKLYFLTLYNSTDFMLSGYSADLSLCSLDPAKLKVFKKVLINLVGELKTGLDNNAARELILLAHLESQSYWNESYTDLYDFCRCLKEGCTQRQVTYGKDKLLTSLGEACGAVIADLGTDRSNQFSKLVIFSEHFGSKYQYSHGLSVYFPWSRPVEDLNEKIMENYGEYLFTKDFKTEAKDDSWMSFLESYFTATMRPSRINENKNGMPAEDGPDPEVDLDDLNLIKAAAANFGPVGALEHKASGAFEGKASGAAGAACSCPSIKNYADFSISPGAALAFSPDSDDALPEKRKGAAQRLSSRAQT